MRITRLEVSAYDVPTEEPESDGTLGWDKTTVAVVEPVAEDGTRGLGFTYGSRACATLVEEALAGELETRDLLDIEAAWQAMVRKIRNNGRPGISSMAIAAVDVALWDLKAKLLGLPLFRLLGAVRDEVPVYGSGGFTSYSDEELVRQLAGWVDRGIPRVKMKIGRQPDTDPERVRTVREAIGDDVELFVDANGAYDRKQASRLALEFEELGVTWFEEPVSSDDLDGLALLREETALDVAAGEYGYDLPYFRRMLEAGAVDVLELDVSRCAGVSEWLRAAALAHAFSTPVSSHCAQSIHAHVGCAVAGCRHLEYFHDHDRVDRTLFDGVLDPDGGTLRPDPGRPGLGLELRRSDAEPYRVA
jgi:L-alanine-DL-glutamate epimerase-like enolase superfamily enzyme